jgi:hypothetical protein
MTLPIGTHFETLQKRLLLPYTPELGIVKSYTNLSGKHAAV